MSAKEGLYATISLGQPGNIVLLTGIELSWSQDNKRFYPMGSLIPASILRGCLSWEGSYKRAFTNMGSMGMGTFNLGTTVMIGTVFPRASTSPLIAGTIVFSGGNLSGMSAESVNAVEETEKFIMYNVTMTD
jgi:hypothetical protein